MKKITDITLSKLTHSIRTLALGGLLGAGALLSGCAVTQQSADALPNGMKAGGHEYLLTVTRPNQLHVIDTETDQLLRSCDVPGTFGNGGIAISPDGRTAYVLSNKWEDIYGFDITNCEITFSAKQSSGNVQIKSFISMAVSADGKELYTVQNPVRKHSDRFETMEPRLAVFNTADGMNAQPVRTFPVDRRITKIAAMHNGEVVLGGGDLKAINPKNGETRLITALQNWDRAPDKWVPPDAFAMHTMGEHVGEFIMPYFTIRWNGEPGDESKADFLWGHVRIDLKTAEVEMIEKVPFEFIVFNWVTDPNDKDVVYGSFNQLSKHNVKTGETLGVHGLDHTYYNINMTTDGNKLYVGGAGNTISVHNPATLERTGYLRMSGDMSTSDLRLAVLK
ncbi:quinohemoprotein amine dehydrogenase subunit beta [Oceanospirillum sediminis]|uniref:Quinohemoprotein amine dehydrogenase subunit beta n=1 Tax=Oceanospirillum sediminis TaxID=2760088 RepID=A0A839ITN5_9GAMM|nr:quinohemoprotein amine dehydrogenase subunit beta [Oceanospirillum sediminis]MBB1488004.1 quinohemoprotein amine dehydrogenase subunit beta [Oceanospirillum sediminis]